MLYDPSRRQGCLATGVHGRPCRQHELELRKDKADVELLMMQQGLSATLTSAPLPGKAEPEAQSGKASGEMVTALEQRLQLLSEEAAQLRETIVKQAGLHSLHDSCFAHPGDHSRHVTRTCALQLNRVQSPLATVSCGWERVTMLRACTRSRRGGDLPAVAGVKPLLTLQELEKQAAVAAAREEGKASAAEQVSRPFLEHQPAAVLLMHHACMQHHTQTSVQEKCLLAGKAAADIGAGL